jgi:hypothetical protein
MYVARYSYAGKKYFIDDFSYLVMVLHLKCSQQLIKVLFFKCFDH